MTKPTIRFQLIAATFAVALLVPAAWAVQPDSKDVTAMFANSGVVVAGLRAVDVGGILVLRGRTADPAQAAAANAYAAPVTSNGAFRRPRGELRDAHNL